MNLNLNRDFGFGSSTIRTAFFKFKKFIFSSLFNLDNYQQTNDSRQIIRFREKMKNMVVPVVTPPLVCDHPVSIEALTHSA